MKIKFDKKPLVVVEQTNHTTKVVNTYIFYDLNICSKSCLDNFKLKIACLVRLI